MTELKVKVNKELKLLPYAEHWHTATCLLNRTESEKKGSYHQYIACITFTAFTFEAFLNHLGEDLFDCWKDLEQIKIKAKIGIVCEKIGVNADYGAMPWQIVPELIAFRNKVAHGKNELLKEEIILPQSEYDNHFNKFLKASWQKTATLENSKRIMRHMEDLLKILWKACGNSDATIFNGKIQPGSASLISE